VSRALLVLALACSTAAARPGGGHTSSGHSSSHSSSHSSGHSGGGGGFHGSGGSVDGSSTALILVVVLFVIIMIIVRIARAYQAHPWTSQPIEPMPRARPANLAGLTATDPDFSRPVFEDFAFALYGAAQRTRGDPKAPLAPYLSPNAAAVLAARGPAPQQVVIGALRIILAGNHNQRDRIVLRIESTLLGASGAVYAIEAWMFARQSGVTSKPPQRTRTFDCPNCGAPWTAGPQRVCAHCGQDVPGRFDWIVDSISVESEEPALASLTGTVPEYGNELPTVVAPDASDQLAAIAADDPAVTWDTLQPRIQMIYRQLNTAWNASDLGPVRGFVTTALRGYLDYWLREYARQGLRNTIDGAIVMGIDLAKVTRDKYFDAFTVRVFASGCDATRDAGGRIVGGSLETERQYTEYWTFIRASTRRGPVHATPTCPNCGAAIAMSDLGDCTYCNAAVENGSFDWTLSKIEQDDWYAG
jgi:hypothetical protein